MKIPVKHCRKLIIPVLEIIFVLLISSSSIFSQQFNGPESVIYDTLNNRYLISNVLSGELLQIDDNGDTTYFDTSLSRTLGMTISGNLLFVADINGLAIFDITTDQKIGNKVFNGMIELNDVTADSSGYLYITDSSAGKIFRMKMSDYSDTTIASGINIPNGILFDAQNNRVLFCQFIPNAPIKSINLSNLSITTVLVSSFTNFDGLAIDSNGDIYVSSWGSNSVYRYDNAFTQPAELIVSGLNGPADIFYNKAEDILAIPNYYTNLVDFIPVQPTAIDESFNTNQKKENTVRIYPNPFNPNTTITYSVNNTAEVTLDILNIIGEKIATLVDEEKETGTYELTWIANSIPSGIYFCRLVVGDFMTIEKMCFVK